MLQELKIGEPTPVPYYRRFLQAELARRCQKNPRYSLRAFASQIGVDPGAFSRILSGKRPMTLKLGQKTVESLSLVPQEQIRFLRSVAEDRMKLGLKSANIESTSSTEINEIELDQFQVISDLYHYGILELTFVEAFDPNPRWIAKRLGITLIEAQLAVARLVRLGLLEKKENKLVKTKRFITTKDKSISHPALRKHQRQVLNGALESLERDSIEQRDMTSMTMAIDPDRLRLAKQMIADFTQTLCEVLETGRRKRVYQLGICLYPLQKEM